MKALKAIATALILLVFACGLPTAATAYAAEEDDELIVTPETILTTANFLDESGNSNGNLFSVLLSIVNAERILAGEHDTVSWFRADYFNDKVSLNLSNGDPANLIGQNAINQHPSRKITTLGGFENLFLGALKELKLDNNSLSTITDSQLSGASNLSKLSARKNNIKEVEQFSGNKISYLDLSENRLTEIDLSYIEKSDGTFYAAGGAYINLDYNYIKDVQSIVLPDSGYLIADISLVCNSMMTAMPDDFGGHNATLFVQGYNPTGSVAAGTYLRIVQQGADVLSVKLFYREDSAYYNADQPGAAAQNNQDGIMIFVAGKTELVFYQNGTPIVTAPFAKRELDIAPARPALSVTDLDGKALNVSDRYGSGIIIKATSSEGAEVRSKHTGDAEFENIGVVRLEQTGSYHIVFEAEFDGIKSEQIIYDVSLFNAEVIMWLIVGAVLLVVIVIAAVIGIRWYRAGGIVAPLSEKERGRAERPRR